MSWGGLPASFIIEILRNEGVMWQIELDFRDEEPLEESADYDENEDWW